MNISIEKKFLENKLKKVQDIVEKNPVIPIISNVLIEAREKVIRISATNFEVGIIVEQEANIIEKGKAVIDARRLYEIVRGMPPGYVDVKKKDSGWVEVNHDNKIVFNLAGFPEEEFPLIEVDKKIKFFEIKSSCIYNLINSTLYASSDDKTRDTLRGLLFERQRKGLRMVATDGHRLALADEFLEGEEETINNRVIIPRKGAREIKKLIEDSGMEGNIKLGLSEKSMVVEVDREVLIIRLIEGEFPNYKKVIPVDNKNCLVVKGSKLRELLKRVMLIAEEETKEIRLSLKPGLLVVFSRRVGVGDAREEMDVEYKGEELELGLNGLYLLDAINVLGEDVIFEIKDGKTPILIKEKGKDCLVSVIMPMIL